MIILQLVALLISITTRNHSTSSSYVDKMSLRTPPSRVRLLAHIPREISENGVIPQKTHNMFRLPAELKEIIFEHLHNDGARTCLALTCKELSQSYDAYLSRRPHNRKQSRTPPKSEKVQFLWLLHKDAWTGIRGYRLCMECCRFKPKDGQWSGDQKMLSKPNLPAEAMVKGPNCTFDPSLDSPNHC